MRLAATLALVLALAAVLVSAAGARPPSWPTWDYPYECWAYQSGQWAFLNGQGYVCEYVGPASSTGFAYVPQ